MDRRTFLSRALIAGTAAMSPRWGAAQAASTSPGLLLIDGVAPQTSPAGLFAFLDPIISQDVPVGIAVRADPADWQEPKAGADLVRHLSALVAEYPGLVDLVFDLPDLADRHPYLRMRAVSEARTRFIEAVRAASGQDMPRAVPRTVVARMPGGETPVIEGLRSAGILTSILLSDGGPATEIWTNDDGTQQVNGGWRLPPSATPENLSAVFAKAAFKVGPLVFAATFPDESLSSDESLFDQGSVIGDAFRRNLAPGRTYMILPSELRLRSGEIFARHLLLCLRAAADRAADGPLAASLLRTGIPFTQIGGDCVLVSGSDGAGWTLARDLAFGDLAPDAERSAQPSPACAAWQDLQDPATEAGEHAGFDVVVELSAGGTGHTGYDAEGALRLPVSLELEGTGKAWTTDTLLKHIEDTAPPGADVVVLVDDQAFAAAGAADGLAAALLGIATAGRFVLRDVPDHLSTVSVKSEPARLLRVARRWPARTGTTDIGAAERDRLMEDAGRAWSFIERLTDPASGLVPATAWLEGDRVQAYRFSTMWDTGSLILGLVSAHSIGLLTDDQFSGRIEGVLGGLATGIFDGLRLPKGLASTDGKAAGDDDYNASDTARLLISLHVLKAYTGADLGISGILNGWDLDRTIRNGVPLTVGGGRLVSSYRSNYAHYIARAFALWGFPVTSPYSDPPSGSRFDRAVHILHDVAEFGPVGTEPHLLEAVELGASDLALAASEALFAAQVEEYLATGKLVAVSEGPVNRAPWFVYQGFQIGTHAGGEWTVEALDSSPRFQTKGFIRAVDMLNSKAAFLWNACRPGAYSDLLVARVRDKATAGVLGFSPGVFAVTGTPDQAYADINTNAVILQAIAYRLNGGKPSVAWAAKG